MPRVKCPHCSFEWEVEASLRFRLHDCPLCNAAFPITSDADSETKEPSGLATYFADNYEPEAPIERQAVIAEAKRRVRVPSIGLIVTGIIGIIASLAIFIGVIIEHLTYLPKDAVVLAFYLGVCISINVYSFLLAAGGRSLRRLENRVLCCVAACFGILGMTVIGMWAFLSLPCFIFGTWAMVALSNREVKHAMRWKQPDQANRN